MLGLPDVADGYSNGPGVITPPTTTTVSSQLCSSLPCLIITLGGRSPGRFQLCSQGTLVTSRYMRGHDQRHDTT